MKIKLDENLPTELGELPSRLGHSVDTVHDEGLRGIPIQTPGGPSIAQRWVGPR